MSLFSIDDEVKAIRLRVTESLDKLDRVSVEAEALIKDLRDALASARAGIAPKP